VAAADFHSITSADVCDVVLMVGFQVLMALDAVPHEPTSSRRRSCGARLRGSSVRLHRSASCYFGSHAKGVAQPGSDVDMLIVADSYVARHVVAVNAHAPQRRPCCRPTAPATDPAGAEFHPAKHSPKGSMH
jgi:hypothetical protein